MVHWNSSPHPVSDIRDWSRAGRLELRPDFQRRAVWSSPAQIMLMDTILRDVPMPKIFLASRIKDGNTYRVVIDGQQRITAILDFLRDGFALGPPFAGPEAGKRFSELEQDTQDKFLSYRIDFNEAINPTDEEVREVYARVNKYTVPLTKQELRRADYPGDFLHRSEELAVHPFFDSAGIFTPANRRRYSDVEYVSELLAAMIGGVQDKKDDLDSFYINYSTWPKGSQQQIKERFEKIADEVQVIFGPPLDLAKTRFRQKADFYSLFLALDEFVQSGKSATGLDLAPLRGDLEYLDENIRPESEIGICREYAIKCVSQANSSSSRRWRIKFMKALLSGTYSSERISDETAQVFFALGDAIYADSSFGCPLPPCMVCDKELEEYVLGWPEGVHQRQLHNSSMVHPKCRHGLNGWQFIERPDGSPDLF